MPVLEINTNIKVANKKEIAVKASKLMAELLGKPNSVPPLPPRPSAQSRYSLSLLIPTISLSLDILPHCCVVLQLILY